MYLVANTGIPSSPRTESSGERSRGVRKARQLQIRKERQDRHGDDSVVPSLRVVARTAQDAAQGGTAIIYTQLIPSPKQTNKQTKTWSFRCVYWFFTCEPPPLLSASQLPGEEGGVSYRKAQREGASEC